MSGRPVILIVDDEKNTRDGLNRALKADYSIATAENGEAALEWLAKHHADVVLSDLRMPRMDGMELLSRISAEYPTCKVIMLTAYGAIETAVEAMKRGAFDFLPKPVDLDRLELLLKRAVADVQQSSAGQDAWRQEVQQQKGFAGMWGTSEPMMKVYDLIRQAGPSRATVLIQGESGTGKELVARALHQNSPRATAPFVPVHCAALAPTLLESELFGHEKGAFTGAVEQRRGRFEMADDGTLFLDEIGEIEASLQVKILRVLEERSFERVGGGAPIQVDVRLIAATNKDLKKEVEAGRFREDLFYRLYVVNMQLPPLRERTGDIELLTHCFLKQLAAENNKPVPAVPADVMARLNAYSWPGNVRELRNVLERAVVLNAKPEISLADLPPEIVHEAAPEQVAVGTSVASTLKTTEKKVIVEALDRNQGNRTKAAKELGISRRTLHRKIDEFDLRKEHDPTRE